MRTASIGLKLRLVAVSSLISLVAGGSLASAANDWSLEKQESGIDVYTRPVEGSGIKEFKAEGVVDAGVEKVLAVLRDSDRFHEWFPNCPESKLLEREGGASHTEEPSLNDDESHQREHPEPGRVLDAL